MCVMICQFVVSLLVFLRNTCRRTSYVQPCIALLPSNFVTLLQFTALLSFLGLMLIIFVFADIMAIWQMVIEADEGVNSCCTNEVHRMV